MVFKADRPDLQLLPHLIAFPDVGEQICQALHQEVVLRDDVHEEVVRNLLHLEVEVGQEGEEEVGVVTQGLVTATQHHLVVCA